MRAFSTLAGLCLAGIAGGAAAQTVDLATPVETPALETPETGTGLRLTAGLGAAFAPDYEGSDDELGGEEDGLGGRKRERSPM